MKSVLISIRPKWCELIASGEKTIEVRKTAPKIETPFKCYIYCTKDVKDSDRLCVLNKQRRAEYEGLLAVCAYLEECPENHSIGNGKVIGEFVCDKIIDIVPIQDGGGYVMYGGAIDDTCFSDKKLNDYLNGNGGYGWHISDLKIYEKPKELREFETLAISRDWERGINPFIIKRRWYKPATRPPQSWCYVEELNEIDI